jgi:hypothetical protein
LSQGTLLRIHASCFSTWFPALAFLGCEILPGGRINSVDI